MSSFWATVTATASGTLTVLQDGRDSGISVRDCCGASVGKKVLVLMVGNEAVAVAYAR